MRHLQLCGELVPQLEEAGFSYEFHIPEEAFMLYWTKSFQPADPKPASNALRYNPPGTTVSVSLNVSRGQAALTFRDDGIGIPSHLRADIFKPFVRADNSRSPETGGTGLGLSIAKRIAQAHGGELSLIDHEGRGRAFFVELPII